MSRGIGEIDPIQDVIPEWAAVVVALLTQLGDVWFLSLVLVSCYWFATERRDDVAALVGLAIGGIGLYRGFKHLFALPRPQEPLAQAEVVPSLVRPLYEATAFATGYGFPSGHATSTTIVYVGLAGVLAIGSRRSRYAAATATVTVVSFSRVALGVHFLVDVVAGVALGLTFLFVAGRLFQRYRDERATLAFALAIGLAGFYFVASDFHGEATILLGAALGAFGGWQLVVLRRRFPAISTAPQRDRPTVVRVSLAVVAILPLFLALVYVPLVHVSLLTPYTVGGGAGLATAAVVASPAAGRLRFE